MGRLDIYIEILTFFAYGFIGYIAEVIYCSVGKGHFVNRGFLYGPCIPIYGFGGIAISIILTRLKTLPFAPLIIFISSSIIASIVEYIGSWALEKLFAVKLWDYSNKRWNINGRICIRNSTLFGLMGLIAVYLVEEPFQEFLYKLPFSVRRITSLILLALFSIDFILSTMKMSSFKNALHEISKKAIALRDKRRYLTSAFRDKLDSDFASYVERVRRRHRRIIKSFPGATSRFDGIDESIKTLIAKEREVMDKIKKLKR